VTDLLDSIRRQLRTRLDDLRPMVREYERLEEAEKALSDAPPTSAGRTPRSRRAGASSPSGGSRHGGSRRRASSTAERDANRERILSLLGQRPGITRAELKEAAGLSGAGVAQNLRRLLDRGDVREEPLPGGVTGYRLSGDGDA
jgi:DNA-binding transcriptional ArsR family regulator